MLLTTEDGKIITAETIPGITGASSLNDINIQQIIKEDFTTNPALEGWIIGSDWVWDETNHNIKSPNV